MRSSLHFFDESIPGTGSGISKVNVLQRLEDADAAVLGLSISGMTLIPTPMQMPISQ